MSLPTGSPGETPPAADAPSSAESEPSSPATAPPAAVSEPSSDRFAAPRAALASLDERGLDEHAEVFARVHADLQAALAEIDGL